MKTVKGWIGVDLDGTLAHYDRWRGATHIGAPVAKMVGHVKTWLAHGDYDVKVFTARVSSRDEQERAAVEQAIHVWCEEHIGQRLEVVCAKDYAMVALFDDRATQVRPNTGITLAEECEVLLQERDALAQQLADVAYLAEWIDGGIRRGVDRYHSVGGGEPLWFVAEADCTIAEAPTLPALGARLRALSEEGGR